MHHWPSPSKFVRASEQQVRDVIWSLGMVNVRYKRLVEMTYDFMRWDLDDATQLYGIGKYGSDSYEIFFKQNYAVEPTDKELIRYLEQEVSVY
jgi:methyl-CpG-binding domain protein 4